MQPFDADKYLGRWHMFRQSAGQDFLKNRDCVVAEYSWLDDAKTRIKAVNSSQSRVQKDFFDESKGYTLADRTFIEGKVKRVGEPDEARLAVQFFPFTPWGSYNVIDTDYENFAIVYACRNDNISGKLEYAWVIGRDYYANEEERAQVDEAPLKAALEKNVPGISYDKIFGDKYAVQGEVNGCKYPEPEDLFVF